MSKNRIHYIGALSPEMALLGQLYASSGYGYDLHRKVIADLGEVWHISQSQAYAILRRLESVGEISVEEEPQEKLPSKQVLRMTPKGRDRFLTWLETPSGGSTRAIRMEFVTRLYFLTQYFPEKIPETFEIQRVEAKIHIQRLEKIRTELPGDQIYNLMSLDLRLKQLKMVLDWLDEYQKVILSQ